MKVIATFDHTHDALGSETVIKDSDWRGRLIPVPEKLDASCGLALRVEVPSYNDLKELLESQDIFPRDYYLVKSYQEYEQL